MILAMYALKKLFSGSLFYSIANSIEAMVPFLLAPLLTRSLSPADYGMWVLFVALVTFFRPIVSLTVEDALRMRYYDMKKEARSQYVFTAFIVTTLISLTYLGVTALWQEPLSAFMQFPAEWIKSLVIMAYLFGLFYTLLAFNQFAHDRKHFLGLQLVQSVVSIVLIATLVLQGYSWQGAVIGKMGGMLVAVIIGTFWLTPQLDASFLKNPCKKYAKEQLKFGIHYLPTGLGLVMIGLTDRLVIVHKIGIEEGGLYGAAALFGAVLFIGVRGFIMAWMPWLFRHLKDDSAQNRKEIKIASLAFFLLVPIAGFAIYIMSLLVAPFLIGKEFHDSFSYIPLVIAATVAQGFFFHNQAFLHFRKKLSIMAIINTLSIALNIALSIYLAGIYGVYGVIVATIISYSLSFLVSGMVVLYVYRAGNITTEENSAK